MAKKNRLPGDTNQRAKSIVDMAVGEKPKSHLRLLWEETIKDSHLFVHRPQLPKISLLSEPESQQGF